MRATCGAKTRSGEPCKGIPMANGRCRMHGGNAGRPIIHGRYSKHIPAQIQAKIDDFKDGDPFDLLDELSAQRALFAEYLGRFEGDYPLQEQNIDTMVRWLNQIGVMVERISKIRNESALTAAEVQFLQVRAVDIALKYFPDDTAKQERFITDLFSGITTGGERRPALVAGKATRG
jgi:hypothetical protein